MKNVFYFTAEWCGPCKKTRPIVEEMKREGFEFQIIDADYEQLLVKRFEIKPVWKAEDLKIIVKNLNKVLYDL